MMGGLILHARGQATLLETNLHYPESHAARSKVDDLARGQKMSKDLKASLLQNCRKITRPHLIKKHSTTKNKPLKKSTVTTPPNTKTPNPKRHFVEKRESTPPLLKPPLPTTRGQRHAKTGCQKPINKYNKLGK